MSHENTDVDSLQLSPKQKKQRTDIDDDALLPVDAAIIFSTVNDSSSSSRRVTMNMLGNDEQDETTNVADGSTIAENQDEDELLPADVDSQHDITTKIVTPNTTQKAKQVAAFSMPWLQQYGNDGFTLFDSDDDGEYHASPSYGFAVRISDDGGKIAVTNLTNN